MKLFILSLTVVLGSLLCTDVSAAPWVFAMADTVEISTAGVMLSDLSTREIPVRISNLKICASGKPGSMQSISRKTVLRYLVTNGYAAGVSFKGARDCVVIRTGKSINPNNLRPDIRKALQPLVPAGLPGAPATWFELELPEQLAVVDDKNLKIRIQQLSLLTPGRNHLSIYIDGTGKKINFPVTVILHQFNETAKAVVTIKRGDVLTSDLFKWEWVDLCEKKIKTDFHGRNALNGLSCARTIQAGDYLRRTDLKATPVVFAGDRVELQIHRGSLFASVNATARREGSVGQTIPVRNELTKQVMNVRVVGPGVVKWRN